VYFTSGQGDDYGVTVVKLAKGAYSTIAGGGAVNPGDGGPGTSADIEGATGLTVDSGGVYVAQGSLIGPGFIPFPSQRIRVLFSKTTYVQPTPSIVTGGVLNGATFAGAPIAPGSIASVFGSFGFASPALPSGAPLPTELAGLAIRFQVGSGIDAPLFYASTGQINFQVPWELSGQSLVAIQPVLNGSSGPSQSIQLAPFAPGIFNVGLPGFPQAAILDSSNALIGPTNPATVGSLIQIYCTGLGLVTNVPGSGQAASNTTLSQTTTTPIVTIGGVRAKVLFSGLAPGTVGEYQVNVQVPAGAALGSAVPLVLSIGGAASNPVTIALQ